MAHRPANRRAQKPRVKPLNVALTQESRDQLGYIMQQAVVANTKAGAIRGVLRKYSDLLRLQVDAERDGGRLLLTTRETKSTPERLVEVDLRL